MGFQLLYTKTFLKELRRLPQTTRKKIEQFCFDSIAEASDPFKLRGLDKLSGYDKYYKKRFGDYRVGIEIDTEKSTIVFRRVLHRKDIYRYYP